MHKETHLLGNSVCALIVLRSNCLSPIALNFIVPICGDLMSNKMYKKLMVAYNNVFRYFLRLPRDEQGRPCSASGMFVTRRLRSFQEIMRHGVFKFINRLDASTNVLVKCTLFKNVKDSSKLRKHWNSLLQVQGVANV